MTLSEAFLPREAKLFRRVVDLQPYRRQTQAQVFFKLALAFAAGAVVMAVIIAGTPK